MITFCFSEDLILFDPLVSPTSKHFAISKRLTRGVVSQLLGNWVSFALWEDSWLFSGLTKFLEYQINEANYTADNMFVSEVLHPTLHVESYTSEFPISVDEALSEALAEKGEKLQFLFSAIVCGQMHSMRLHKSFP